MIVFAIFERPFGDILFIIYHVLGISNGKLHLKERKEFENKRRKNYICSKLKQELIGNYSVDVQPYFWEKKRN